jgi:putative FmdB family regulatory protein
VPTYEYACQSCGTHVEVFQRFSEASLTECSVCGGPLRKVFHPAGILFKGSGFYVTDSRAGSSKSGGGEPSKPSSEGAKTPAGGSKTDPGSGTTSSGEGSKTSSDTSPTSAPSSKPKEKSA